MQPKKNAVLRLMSLRNFAFVTFLFLISGTKAQTGNVLWERWNNFSGTLSELRSTSTPPDETKTITSLDAPLDYADSYKARIKGYLYPDKTGNYTFYIASDDQSELWLSTNSTASNAVKLCEVTSWANHLSWTANASQKSVSVALVAGSVYYFDAVMQEGGGGDNLSVGWTQPGETASTINVVSSQYISQTANSLVNVSTLALPEGNLQKGITDQILYKLALSVTQSTANLATLTLGTTGTFTPTDVKNFKLWYNPSAASIAGATKVSSTVVSVVSGNTIIFSGISQAIDAGNTGFFILTADITSSAIPGRTLNITSTPFSNLEFTNSVVLSGTNPAAAGTGKSIIAANAKLSDIILNSSFTLPATVNYLSYQGTDINTANSIEIAKFSIRDGGSSGDADANSTQLSELTLNISNSTNIRRVALYDGTTEIAETNGAAIVIFSGLSHSAPQGSTKDFTIRVSYNTIVTDNQVSDVSIAAVVANGSFSLFASVDAGGASTSSVGGTHNKILVNATKLLFTTQPSTNALYGGVFLQPAVVSAADGNGSVDVDYTTNISLSNSGSFSMNNNSKSPVNGVATFNDFNIPAVGNNITLTASSGVLTSAVSNPINIFSPIAGNDDNPSDMGNTVLPGSVSQRILRITVKSLASAANPDTLTQMVFNLGSTTTGANIASANVYTIDQWGNIQYSSLFNTATVSGGKLTFNGQFIMTEMKDYILDLFYNIADVVNNGDNIDGAIESVIIDGTVFTPTIGNGNKVRTILSQGLTGTITVDKTLSADVPRTSYKDFNSMLTDLNKYGVGAGGLIVIVKDDQTFSYTTDINISQTGLPGSPLLIKRSGDGTNGPVISKRRGGSYFNHLMVINGARFLTIDGINFKGTSGDGDSKYFTGLTFTATPGQTVESVEIKNCRIDLDMINDINSNESRFGGIGVRFAFSFDNTFDGTIKNISIHHNQILNLREGIRVERRNGKLENVEINNNEITNFVNTGINIFGGDNRNVDGPLSIHNNDVSGASIDIAGEWGGYRDLNGIIIRNLTGTASIYGNKVHTLSNTNVLSRVFGIALHGNNGSAIANVYNNMVWDLSAANSSSGEACNAFSIENQGKFNLYYNSALLDYSTAATNTSRILLTYSWQQPQIELINNLFVNKVQTTGSAKTAVLDIDPARISTATDNNLYHVSAPGAIHLINLNGAKQTLAEYKAQVPGKELNSLSDTVAFLGANNIHIRTDVVAKIESAGKPITSPFIITTDIDGDTRNSLAPDMGADEGNFIEYFVNKAPTINSVPKPAPILNTEGQQTIALSGISDGDAQKIQNISLSASSSNNAIVRIDGLNYTGNETSAVLKYTPLAAGTVTVSVKLKDDGGIANNGIDTTVISFQVVVENILINNVPTMNSLSNLMAYSTETSKIININGIEDGDQNKNQNITLSVYTDKADVVTNLQTNYVSPNSTGTISFKPGIPGIATVYVKIQDDGGIADGGVDTLVSSFLVEVKAPSGFGYIENFDDNVLTRWYGGSYGLSEQNHELKIIPGKASVWDGFGFSFPQISIKDHPFVSLKIKSNFDFNVSMAVGKVNGKIDNYPLRIETIGTACAQEIVASTEYQEYSFDYTGLPVNTLDSVSNVHFVLNPLTRDFGGAPNKEIYFDDIKLGEIALHTPAITTIENQAFTVKSSGTESRSVNFRNVTDGSTDNNTVSISAYSSNPACIPDPQVIYTSHKRTGSLILQPNVTATGESVISVVVSAPNTTNKVMTFKVRVAANASPSMKALPDILAKKGEKTTVALRNIDDGNPESAQLTFVTAKSSNTTYIPVVVAKHDSTGFTGTLSFTPEASIPAGTIETILVKIKDNGGKFAGGIDSALYSFNVTVYDEINHKPTFDSIQAKSIKAVSGNYHLELTGISDGDRNIQNLSFAITSSSDSVFTNFSVGNVINGVASLSCDLTGKTGSSIVTLRVTDDGGKPGNNGNQFIEHSFVFSAVPSPLTGLIADYKPFIGNVAASGITTSQDNGMVDIMADGTVHISGTVMQQSFPANNFDLYKVSGGKDIDISANKYISFKFKGSSSTKIEAPENKPLDKTKIFFRLIDHISPGQPGSGYSISVIELNISNDDAWHDIYLDFTGLFYKDKEGKQTDSTRITSLMLDINCLWFQQIKGDYYFKDLKLGDLADRPVMIPHPTLNNIPNQVVYKGQNPKPIVLTGITDGSGNPTANLTVTSNKPQLITGFVIGDIINGTAQLTYTLNSGVADSAVVKVIANNTKVTNAIPDTVVFRIYVVDTAVIATNIVTIDFNKTYQTFSGMGTMLSNSNDPVQVQQIKDMNITLMRFSASSEFEPVNDNSDPNVSDFSNYKHEALPSDIIRQINENTNCHKFFYTPWSPANWMKQNKGSNPDPAAMWAGNNRLKPEMYEEFAEYLVAICKTIKEDAGVELYAISLQNEPTFNEPYASCQYSGEEFRDLMKILGPRLKAENLNTRIMMPEDIATMLNWVTEKVDPVNADPDARGYLGIMAVHLYDPDGINVGGAGASRWNELLNIKKTTKAEGLWMTETSGFGNVWEGYWGKDYMSGNPQYFPGPLDFAGSIYTSFKAGNISGWTDFEGTKFKVSNDLSGSVFKNYSAYLNPGAVMVDAISSNNNLLSLAFKNTDNSVTAILLNKSTKPIKVKLKGNTVPEVYRSFTTQNWAPFTEGATLTNGTVVLPPQSITTLYHSNANQAPAIDASGNVIVELSKGAKQINLSGIGYGADITPQSVVSVTAVSGNPSIAGTTVDYLADATSATLTINPLAYGTTLITVKVKDNGGIENGGIDTTTIKFFVTVVSSMNHLPTIMPLDPITINEDADSMRIRIAGISDGDMGTQHLLFSVISSNPDLTGNPRINYVNGSDTASLVVKPRANLNGTATFSILLTDDGGDENNNGNQSVKIDVPVIVMAVNDAPVITASLTSATINIGPVKRFQITVDDGDPDVEQTLSYVVRNSNPSVANAVIVESTSTKLTLNVTGKAAGNATLTFVVKDNGGILNGGIDSAQILYSITVLSLVGLNEPGDAKIKVYPNPADDYINITLNNEHFENAAITDLYGRVILTQSIAGADKACKISVRDLPSGMYFIVLKSDVKSRTLSFVRR